MKRLFPPRLDCLVVLVCLAVIPGCGKPLPPVAPVSGKVTVDGKPLAAGQVSLLADIGMPTSENKVDVPSTGLSTGNIDSNGEYKITTAGKDGAPIGKYKVTVTPTMMPSSDPKKAPAIGFARKFSDPKDTPLRIEVVASPAAGAYDLKLTSK
jgi:hypothetical protein